MKMILLLFVALFSACGGQVSSDPNNPPTAPAAVPSPDVELQKQVVEIAKEANGKVGVYATVIETGETVTLNENEHFAMQSVVKLPISMAVMRMVDDGKIDFFQHIYVNKADMVESSMQSSIRDEFPNGIQATLNGLVVGAISFSDGTASDVLQRRAGGAAGVQEYIDSLGIDEVEVKHTHKEFGTRWELQYENWASPKGIVSMLQALWDSSGGNASLNSSRPNSNRGVRKAGNISKPEIQHGRPPNGGVTDRKGKTLSQVTADYILKAMTESNNPPNRLKGMLPQGTVVAHKTGTGGTRDGITSATNDVGIITLPNGNHVAIAVFVGDSKAALATREAVIAKIAKAVYDKWSSSKPSEPVKAANFNERHTLN